MKFANRHTILVCTIVATVLALPSLSMGFLFDDYMQVAKLEGWGPASGNAFDLYSIFPGGETVARMIRQGPLPWWYSSNLHIHFWRPLASAIMAFDHFVFGRSAGGYHAVALAFQAGLIAASGFLFRRAVPALWPLALFLFAVDDAHAQSVGWIAAHNALFSVFASILALVAYVRYREEDFRAGLALAVFGVAASLLAGEAGVSAFAYIVAYELLGAPRRRLGAILPFLLVFVPYIVMYKLRGYGTRGTHEYIDMAAHPVTFLTEVVGRVPALVGNLVFGPPADLWAMFPPIRPALTIVGYAALVLLALWWRPALAGLSEADQKGVRWLALGALFALIPSSAAILGERLVFPASLGVAPLLAAIVKSGWERVRSRTAGFGLRALAGVGWLPILVPNVVLAPLLFSGKLLMQGKMAGDAVRTVSELEVPAEGPIRLATVWADDPLTALNLPYIRGFVAPADVTRWRSYWTFSDARVPQTLHRVDERTLELSTTERFFDVPLFSGTVPRKGNPVRLDGVEVSVAEERDGYPTRIAFRFDTPRDLAEIRFTTLSGQKFHPLTPPEVGQSLTIR